MPLLSGRHVASPLFGVATVGCLMLVIRALILGSGLVQVVLLVTLTLYPLALTLDMPRDTAYVKRLLAIPLGTLGVIAYLIGAPTDLPILFIILGVGGVVDLVRDPFDDHDDSLR
jgi:hypothetical protein